MSGLGGWMKDKLRTLGKKLEQVHDLMESEAKLQSQLLDLLDGVQGVYKTRYLQAFDKVTGKCEAVCGEIDGLPDSRQFRTIAELARIDALASVDVSALKGEVTSYKEMLFQSPLDHNGVERALKDRPLPENCPLHVDEAEKHVTDAEAALASAREQVQSALRNMASLLRQPALRALLEQGKQERFIADVLAAPTDDKLADILAECVPADPGNARLLAKYLKRIVVKVVHLHDFRPTKTKVEKADIEGVVTEFRRFLETAVDGDGKGQSTIIEIK